MSRDEFDVLLDRMHHAARMGLDLRAVPTPATAALLGTDAVTVSLGSACGALELLWHAPRLGLGPELDDLQFTFGEGPTIDAATAGRPVVEPDLAATPDDRWPMFLPAVQNTPVRSLIALPLKLGAIVLGVLSGYRTTPTSWAAEQRRKLDHFARLALDLLVQTPPDDLGTDATHTGLTLHRTEVHQATGILSAQLDIPLDHALLRLRAHASSNDRPLLDIARDVIARRLDLSNHDS